MFPLDTTVLEKDKGNKSNGAVVLVMGRCAGWENEDIVTFGGGHWGLNVFLLARCGGPQINIKGPNVLVRPRKKDTSKHKTICWRIKTPRKNVTYLKV